MEDSNDMKEKLAGAAKMAEEAKAQRRRRAVKGSHLLDTLVERAKDSGCTFVENSGFYKFTGAGKGRAIYIAKKGGRVDLSGFTVEHQGIKQISEESARDKHLGKVRGQLDFSQNDESVLSAYESALMTLSLDA